MRQLTEGELWRYREMSLLPDDYIVPAAKTPANPPAAKLEVEPVPKPPAKPAQ